MEGPFDDEIAKAINPQESALIDGDGMPSAVDQNDEDDDIEVLSQSSPTNPGHRAEPKVSLSDYESVRSLSASGEITAEGQPEAAVGAGKRDECDGHEETVVKVKQATGGPPTSTPLRSEDEARSLEPELPISPVQPHGSNGRSSSSTSNERSRVRFRQHEVVPLDPLKLHVPLVGFEVMEERARFTVFKLHVNVGEKDNWFVFRRYTDFTQLQQKLKKLYPMFRLPLPPKRWFRDNYERDFLEERMLGLQAFVDSVLCHSDLCNSLPVQEFFCFNDPPGPHDSVEESRAYCEELEEALYELKKVVREKDTEIEILHDELSLYKSQVEMLSTALREHNLNGASTAVFNNLPSPAGSLAECDLTAPEADQSYPSTQTSDKVKTKTLPETEQASRQTTVVVAETKVNVTAPSRLSVAKTSNGREKKDSLRRKSAFSKLLSTER